MLKRYLTLIFVVATAMALRAERITLSAAEGHPGDVVDVTMSMDGGSSVCAIDMTLPLGDNLTYITGSAATTERTANHSITASVVDGALRMVIYNVTLSPIQGEEGAIATFRLKLGDKPGAVTLSPTLILSNEEGSSVGASVVAGNVTVKTPELTIVTPQIDYGHIPIRSTYTRNITLKNSGNEPLTINSLTSSEATVLAVSPQTMTLAPGASQNAVVTFAPTVRGAYQAEIEVDCNAVNNFVYGRHQKVKVVADPFSVNELHIVRTQGDSDSEAEVFVRVNNMEPLVGAQFSVTLPKVLQYVDGSAKAAARAEGSSITAFVDGQKLTILLYSLSNTPYEGEDGNILSFRVSLVGRSGSYRLNPTNVVLSNEGSENMTSAVEGNYVVIKSPTISVANSCDFGKQDITGTISKDLSVRNTGQNPLVIERVSFLSEGYSVATTLPLTIEPSQTGTLTIVYAPEEIGEFSTIMNIYSNDPELRMKGVSISGEAYSPNDISLSGKYDSKRGFLVDVNLTNHYPISALQFDLTASDATAVESGATIELTERMTGFSKVISSLGEGRYRVVAYVLDESVVTPGEGKLMTLCIPSGAETPAEVTFSISGIVLSSPDSQNMLTPNASVPSVSITTVTPGDANGDGRISISDVSAIIYCINGKTSSNFNAANADANGDGRISISDVTKIINLINNPTK